ncbi:hypothetical protein BX600DRAFT_23756 [Xylariales sp. PMI_506]|nr:hypothetical protein BX600DRAFT_23756 [Xylariales sp. PMI_506]
MPTTTTTTAPAPRAPRRAPYAPAVSSPLNPTASTNPPQRSSRRRSGGSDSAPSRRQTGGTISPTQRLMRKKAAAAWQSLVVRNAIMVSTKVTMTAALARDEDRCRDPASTTASGAPDGTKTTKPRAECSKMTAPTAEAGMEAGILRSQPSLVDGLGALGLGIMGAVDSEKPPLIGHWASTSAALSRMSATAKYGHLNRPWGPRKATGMRLLMAIGLMFMVGWLTLFCSRQDNWSQAAQRTADIL